MSKEDFFAGYMAGYDSWKLHTPNEISSQQAMKCTSCGQHEFGDVEDLEGQPHCFDDDEHTVYGVLRFDDAWEWDASDDPQFPY